MAVIRAEVPPNAAISKLFWSSAAARSEIARDFTKILLSNMLNKKHEKFPLEVLDRVARQLTVEEMKKVMVASPEARRAAEKHPLIWKRHIHGEKSQIRNGKFIQEVKKEHVQSQMWIDSQETFSATVKHAPHVPITQMVATGDILIVSSDFSAVKIYDLFLGTLATLEGHRGCVWTFDYKDSVLVTGSTDRTAKIWDCSLGVCLKTLYGHTSTVRVVKIAEECVITGARDNTVRVWCIKTGQCRYVLQGHSSSVRDIAIIEGQPLFVSGSYDGRAILWNYRTGQGVRWLARLPRRIYAVCSVKDAVAIGGMDQILKITRLNGKSLFESKDTAGTIVKIKTDSEGLVYALTTDGVLRKWDVNRKVLKYEIHTKSKPVDFSILNHLVVVGVHSHIALYARDTGRFIRVLHVTKRLYSMCVTENALFFGTQETGPTEIHAVHFKTPQEHPIWAHAPLSYSRCGV